MTLYKNAMLGYVRAVIAGNQKVKPLSSVKAEPTTSDVQNEKHIQHPTRMPSLVFMHNMYSSN